MPRHLCNPWKPFHPNAIVGRLLEEPTVGDYSKILPFEITLDALSRNN